jgi:VIT1/CCC1 family predicted Fe2+/Mn2+ transporter
MKELKSETIDIIKHFQRNELTESIIYFKLAKREKLEKNKEVLVQIAKDEETHHNFWKEYTHTEIKPNWRAVYFFYWIIRIFGITFGIKFMEKGEKNAQRSYAVLLDEIPETQKIIDDEEAHEQKLISLIEEERLNYVGSIVLGLNDALVELTGALAGLSFGLQNTKLIAFAGLITGVAAGFSMAAAEYLSQSHEEGPHPFKSAFYTGIAYFVTVGILIMPYLFLENFMVCLSVTIVLALLIILFFNYYISVAKDLPFKRRFAEMALISIGVSAITFGVSVLLKKYFGAQL